MSAAVAANDASQAALLQMLGRLTSRAQRYSERASELAAGKFHYSSFFRRS